MSDCEKDEPQLRSSFLAWGGFAGDGVRVATADINADSFDDIVIGSGPGGVFVA